LKIKLFFLLTFLVKRKYCRNFAASKEKNMKHLNSKEIIAIWFAIVAAIISIMALWMPPQGIIDETVLVLIGQVLLFIATLMGVDGALTRFHELRQKSPPVDST
jgi:hypothetical protein